MEQTSLKSHEKVLLINRNTLRFHLLVILHFVMIVQTLVVGFTDPDYYMNAFYTIQLILLGVFLVATLITYYTLENNTIKSKLLALISLIFYTLSLIYYYDKYPIAITTILLALIVMEVIAQEKAHVIVFTGVSILGYIFYLILNSKEIQLNLISNSISIFLPLIATMYLALVGIRLLEKDNRSLVKAIFKLTNERKEIVAMNKAFIAAEEEIREQFEKIYEHAYKDMMTGLFNKNYLLESLDAYTRDSESNFSLLFISCNNFRLENNIHQYNISNDIFIHMAERLIQLNNSVHEIGHYNGDIFYALIENSDDATKFANDYVDLYAKPIETSVIDISLNIHIGIYDKEIGHGPGDAINYAEIAMYQAKLDKPMGYTTFSVSLLNSNPEKV